MHQAPAVLLLQQASITTDLQSVPAPVPAPVPEPGTASVDMLTELSPQHTMPASVWWLRPEGMRSPAQRTRVAADMASVGVCRLRSRRFTLHLPVPQEEHVP